MLKVRLLLIMGICFGSTRSLFGMDADDFISGFVGKRSRRAQARLEQEGLEAILDEAFDNVNVMHKKRLLADNATNRETRASVNDIALEKILDDAYDFYVKPIKKVVVFLKNKEVLSKVEDQLKSCFVGYDQLPATLTILAKRIDDRTILNPRTTMIKGWCSACRESHLQEFESVCGYEFELARPQTLAEIEAKFDLCGSDVDSVHES